MNDLYLLTILLLLIACSDKNAEPRDNVQKLPQKKAPITLPTVTGFACEPRKIKSRPGDDIPEDLGKLLFKLLGKTVGIVIDGHTFEGTVIFVKNKLVFLRGEGSMGWFDWTKASGLIMSC